MRINSINNINSNYHRNQTFKSQYIVDGSSAASRSQVLTLGMLMCNFWLMNARPTFNQAKYTNVYGNLTMNVKDMQDRTFERILKANAINFKKITPDNNNYSFSTVG